MSDLSHDAALPSGRETDAEARFQQFALQVLGLLLYGGFAILATILAFVHFWPAGVLLALILAWRGFAPVSRHRGETAVATAVEQVAPASAATGRKTGNATFDAYRSEMLTRLETEQQNFEGFLERLRAAKDEREFDTFMDERAARARPVAVPGFARDDIPAT
jgi:hypothetical protein